MKVLFLMFSFPDMDKSFNMFTTIVEEFHKNGHEVSVLAPADAGNKTELKTELGIPILRVKTLPIKNVPFYIKGIANIVLPFQFAKARKKFFGDKKYDLIIMPTPPFTLAGLAMKLKKKLNAKFYLILRDVFPQNAVDMGFMKKDSILHSFFLKKENILYETADYIGCMSEGSIEYILRNHPQLDEKKLHVLRNWQKLNLEFGKIKPDIKSKYGLNGKFVVVFGGNMGKPQQLENILALAKRCEGYPDVVFLLLGQGVQKQKLENEVKSEGIANIKLMDAIPKLDYQSLLASCDIGLISLHKNFTFPNIPSKTLDYFNLGIPVLASIDSATDYGKVLDEANAGLWSIAGDIDLFKLNFDKLYKDKNLRELMGNNGRKYFEKYLIPEIAYQSIFYKVTGKNVV